MNPQDRWRLAASDALGWRSWDGESVVHDERSGETHRLGLAASAVFVRLAEEGAARGDALAALLEHAFGRPDGLDGAALADVVLGELVRLQLVERLP